MDQAQSINEARQAVAKAEAKLDEVHRTIGPVGPEADKANRAADRAFAQLRRALAV